MKKFLIIPFIWIACAPGSEEITAQHIIDEAILTHGLHNPEGKKVSFTFRNKDYSMIRNEQGIMYTRSFQDSLGFVRDVLINISEFSRSVDGIPFELSEEWSVRYANSVNSVLYFVQLPYMLNDPAVIKKYQGTIQIKGKKYHQIEIRFKQEDGGVDFEDVFLYWFNTENFSMDYLAYSYLTDEGGIRFREAFNRRTSGGIVFQDYINYKPADKNIGLENLPTLFEKGELKELSRIINIKEKVEFL